MKVEIKIDDSYIEPKILILTAAMTEDVNLKTLLKLFPAVRMKKSR